MKHKLLLAVVAGGLSLAMPAAAEPTMGGIFRPGESLGGVRLGMTPTEVLETWGARHGVCRDCRRPTWYFNERPFSPEGTGVVFEEGRVAHAFTVWKPTTWRTPEGLELGQPGGEIGQTYGELTELACSGYTALVRDHPTSRSVFYVFEDALWGFGLTRPGESPCV